MSRVLKSRIPPADELLRVAGSVAPQHPPAAMPAAPRAEADKLEMMSVRLMGSTITALAVTAKAQGVTQRQFLAKAMAAAGVQVAPEDLNAPPPPRRRA